LNRVPELPNAHEGSSIVCSASAASAAAGVIVDLLGQGGDGPAWLTGHVSETSQSAPRTLGRVPGHVNSLVHRHYWAQLIASSEPPAVSGGVR
jgi:hypothetical protein